MASEQQNLQQTIKLYVQSAHLLDSMRLQVWERMQISFPQLRILFRIRNRPGIDLRSLSADLSITPSGTGQQVDKLVGRGLLRRSEAPGDRRRIQLELTELGQQATGEISRALAGYMESVFARLSNEELAQLGALLERVVQEAASIPPPNI